MPEQKAIALSAPSIAAIVSCSAKMFGLRPPRA
jgi:hypothetical protein